MPFSPSVNLRSAINRPRISSGAVSLALPSFPCEILQRRKPMFRAESSVRGTGLYATGSIVGEREGVLSGQEGIFWTAGLLVGGFGNGVSTAHSSCVKDRYALSSPPKQGDCPNGCRLAILQYGLFFPCMFFTGTKQTFHAFPRVVDTGLYCTSGNREEEV